MFSGLSVKDLSQYDGGCQYEGYQDVMIRGGKVSRYIIHAHTACTDGTGRPRDFTEVVKVKSNQSKVSSQQLLRLCFPRLRLWLRFLVVITALGTRLPNTALSRN